MGKLVTIKTFGKLREAQIAKGCLNSNGIEAEFYMDSFGGYAPEGVRGIKLKVREEDKEKALAVFGESE